MTTRQGVILVIAGAVMAAVGSLLSWATLTTGLGHINIAGTTGDGTITLVVATVTVLLGFVQVERELDRDP